MRDHQKRGLKPPEARLTPGAKALMLAAAFFGQGVYGNT